MNYLVVVSYASLFILGFCDNLRGPLFPEIIKYFRVNDTLGSTYFAVTSLVAFFSSYFIRKKNSTYFLLKILNWGVLAVGISFLIQSYSESYTLLLVGVFFFGISFGFLGVAQNNLVIQGSNAKSRSKMLTGLHSMYGVSSLISPLFVASFPNWGWKNILFFVSLVPMMFFVIVLWLNQKRKGLLTVVPIIEGTADPHFFSGIQSFIKDEEKGRKRALKEKIICYVISLYVLAEILLGSRLPLFMRRNFGFSLEQSSYYVTLFFVFMLLGRLIVTFYPPKISLKKQLIGSLVSSIVFILMGMYINPVFLVVCGFTMAPFYPLAISFISELAPTKATELISTTVAIQALFVVGMHLSVGKLTDLTDIRTAFWLGPLCLLASLGLLIPINRKIYE